MESGCCLKSYRAICLFSLFTNQFHTKTPDRIIGTSFYTLQQIMTYKQRSEVTFLLKKSRMAYWKEKRITTKGCVIAL